MPTVQKLETLDIDESEVAINGSYSALWFPFALTKIPT